MDEKAACKGFLEQMKVWSDVHDPLCFHYPFLSTRAFGLFWIFLPGSSGAGLMNEYEITFDENLICMSFEMCQTWILKEYSVIVNLAFENPYHWLSEVLLVPRTPKSRRQQQIFGLQSCDRKKKYIIMPPGQKAMMNPTRFERMTLRLFQVTGISRATAAPWVHW
jgi:hypothetical protein